MASEMKVKLDKLSVGEQLFLARRRVRETHQQAAKRWGVCGEVYLNWENDRPARLRPNMEKLPTLSPHPNESCVIARRRWNLKHPKDKVGQARLGEILGVSRIWIYRMERGLESCDRLVQYWNDNV